MPKRPLGRPPAPPYRFTGAVLRAARETVQLTQAELAFFLGVPIGRVRRWECDDSRPPVHLRDALERTLRLPAASIASTMRRKGKDAAPAAPNP